MAELSVVIRAKEKNHHSSWIALNNVSWIEPKLVNWFEILQTSSLLSSLDACIRGLGMVA